MRIRKNDNFNDFNFGHAICDFYIDNSKAVAQNIKTKLQEWKYDFFANVTAGIDYRVRLGNRGQRNNLIDDIKKIILSVPEVISLESIDALQDDRNLTVNFTYYDIYSENIQELRVGINEK